MSDSNRVLDNGMCILLFKNPFGTYTSLAFPKTYLSLSPIEALIDLQDDRQMLTDDFTPEKSMDRLAEKVFRLGDYQDWPDDPMEQYREAGDDDQ